MTLYQLIKGLFQRVIDRPNNEVFVDCPFCLENVGKQDTKTRLGINYADGIGHCFRCEWKSGDRKKPSSRNRKLIFNALCRVFDVDYQLTDEEITTEEKPKEKLKVAVEETQLPKEYEPLWKGVNDKVGKQALKYLHNRRVTKEQIKKYKIGFCAVGRYAYRIIFPVINDHELHGFVARDFSGLAEAKYLNSFGGKALYNLPEGKQKKLLLVEGVFDVLACERANLNIAIIGNLGSKLKKKQVKIIKKLCRIIYVWCEPDPAGVVGTIKRAKQLKKLKVLVIPPSQDIEYDTDPGDMLPQEIEERVKQAVPFTDGLASLMRTRIAFHSPPRKKKKYAKRTKETGSQ